MTLYSLETLGWSAFFQAQLDNTDSASPMRVAEEQRGAYVLVGPRGRVSASVTGALMHDATGRADYPAVGDWVLSEETGPGQAIIRRLLDRRTRISRKAAGERTDEQIIAANVDTAFLVTSLNQELNLRRIERYLAVIWDSGAVPAVVLSKADLAPDYREALRQVESVAPGAAVLACSSATGEGTDEIAGMIAPGQTTVFLGSSGVGKSSLLNRLMGEDVQAVRQIRGGDDKGRHTTTSRSLLVLPSGGLVIDTPGLRELQLWDAEEGIGEAFSDISGLATACAFADCAHEAEPDCSVRGAIEDGTLDPGRMESYRKLEREQRFIAGKKDHSIRAAEQKKWKQIHKANRQRMRFTGR